MNTQPSQPVGQLLRGWRQRRRLSQLELAVEAEISPKHLSFLETGRSTPSRDMLLRLAEQLDVPLREQNILLVAAGYAPVFGERPLDAPDLQAARQAADLVLTGHEPYPALALDRHWNLLAANRAVPPLLVGIAPELLRPPVNVIRLCLHPAGLAPRIANYALWRAHLLARLRRQIEISADNGLIELLREITAYPVPAQHSRSHAPPHSGELVVVPLRLHSEAGELSFISTTTVFGTPLDITVAELAIESFFPADAATAEVMRRNLEQP
ncbi:MAG TPA: helix-turn-helix transcriptional regulator [Roseiflexaceae bacterium]|nr:helix-turn-helix transcriptional regulator [Roseiflexaceae bacterium]